MPIFRFEAHPQNHTQFSRARLGIRNRRVIWSAFLIAAFVTASCSVSKAAGSFQTKPAFRGAVTTGLPPLSNSSVPNTTPSDQLGGCGRGRIRDAKTHACKGPADIR
jgi:hypothetical protein